MPPGLRSNVARGHSIAEGSGQSVISGRAAPFDSSTGSFDEGASDGHLVRLVGDEQGTAAAFAQPDAPVIADVTTGVTFTTWVGER